MGDRLRDLRVVLHIVQVLVLFSLLGAIANQIWFSAILDTEYTVGKPAGAGIEIDLVVDQDSADGEIHIDGFFTWLRWQNVRNDNSIPTEYDRSSVELTPLDELQQTIPVLVKIAAALGLLLFVLNMYQIKNRWLIGLILSGLVFWILISLIILAPLGYLGELEFEKPTNSIEQETTVHSSTQYSYDINYDSVELEFKTTGFDLGLVNSSELDDVIANQPGTDHPSYIEMEGKMVVAQGKFVSQLMIFWTILFLLIPLGLMIAERVQIDCPQQL